MRQAAPRRGELPASYEAEQAIIGCVLLDEWRVWMELEQENQMLTPEDFYYPEHQAIWRAAVNLFEAGNAIRVLAIVHEMSRLNVLDAVDSWVGVPYTEPYLTQLQFNTWSAVGCSAFARIIKQKALGRNALTVETPRREIAL